MLDPDYENKEERPCSCISGYLQLQIIVTCVVKATVNTAQSFQLLRPSKEILESFCFLSS